MRSTRYIPNLTRYNLQQLHDLLNSMQAEMEMHFINGSPHPISVRQQFFINDLMRQRRASGETIQCNDSDCVQCEVVE